MSSETERLAREAEERRGQLDSTLESLKNRFTPGQIVDEVASYVRNGQGAEMVNNLNRQVRDNPLALGLVGAGIAWLLLGQGVRDTGSRALSVADRNRRGDWSTDRDWGTDHWREDDRDNRFEGAERSSGPGIGARLSSAGSSVGDSLSSAGSSVADTLSHAGSSISDAAHAAGDRLSSAAGHVSDSASRLGHDVRDAAYDAGRAGYRTAAHAGERVGDLGRRAQRTIVDTLHDEPLILGAIAVAVGAAIGAALPSTRTEDEWLGETRDRLRDEAIGKGRETLDKATHVAERAFDAGNAEADKHGLKPTGEGETLAQKVSAVASAAVGTAKDEARKEGLA
ncbi:DUF3618 domain-containing protein [Aureimonas sp. AU4]|uniref:DUF3618 domain-containing protein n=1 Tax=Aureimonas sp. AU4 TaxID=1638163 RepID=UPI000784E61A|nr:DUF3618 domain-containing protein [Aureimonas sp. AU4]